MDQFKDSQGQGTTSGQDDSNQTTTTEGQKGQTSGDEGTKANESARSDSNERTNVKG